MEFSFSLSCCNDSLPPLDGASPFSCSAWWKCTHLGFPLSKQQKWILELSSSVMNFNGWSDISSVKLKICPFSLCPSCSSSGQAYSIYLPSPKSSFQFFNSFNTTYSTQELNLSSLIHGAVFTLNLPPSHSLFSAFLHDHSPLLLYVSVSPSLPP